MDKVREFRTRARECRIAACRASTHELKGHYQQLAETWEKLADERVAFFVNEDRNGAPEPQLDRTRAYAVRYLKE